MLIVMSNSASKGDIDQVISKIQENNLTPHSIPGSLRTAIGVTGNMGAIERSNFANLPGVIQVIRVTAPYKLVSRETKPDNTIINVSGVEFGGNRIPVIAGPCSVESLEQMTAITIKIKESGAQMIRGGVYKPRTSPYSFQGMKEDGLKILSEIRDETGLPFVTEIIDPASLETSLKYADMVQVGARNMQNFALLKEVGKSGIPVLLKRGISATLDEFMMAAEYLMSEGNFNIILCERGIRTYATHSRFTLDISVIPTIKQLSHLPIIVDPSHAAGVREKVLPLAFAGIGAGADGLIVEVHDNPDIAQSDGRQSLYPVQFTQMMSKLKMIAKAVDRTI